MTTTALPTIPTPPPGATAQWGYADVETHTGIRAQTLRGYVHSGHAPQPDGRIGSHPWWWDTTIRTWFANRPGRGVGGGRPRKVTPVEAPTTCDRLVDRRMIDGTRVKLAAPEPCGRDLLEGYPVCKIHRAIDIRAGKA